MSPPARMYRLFGVSVAVEADLVLRARADHGPPDVTVIVVQDEPEADWAAAQELYTTPPREGLDRPDFRFYRLSDRDVIRIEGTGDVHLMDDAIQFHLREPRHAYLVEIVLLGLGMAFWLERKGVPVLHGAAVEIAGGAVAFLATGGAGKSSLSSFLVAGGSALVTEDLLRISWCGGSAVAEPGVAQVRLWPDQAARYTDNWRSLEQPHPGFTKRKLLIGADGVGTMAQSALPLRRIYVLQRTDDPTYEPTVIPLSGAAPVSELLRNSYLPEIADSFGWQARRLSQLVDLSRSVPVSLLRYRSGHDQLPAIQRAITQHIGADGSPAT